MSLAISPRLTMYGFGDVNTRWTPAAAAVQPNKIPDELRRLAQWTTWDWVSENENWRKVPICPRLSLYMEGSDPEYAVDFETALMHQRRCRLPGVGVILTSNDPYIAVDIDDCVDPHSGRIDLAVRELVDSLSTYTEYSPSGTGLRMMLKSQDNPEFGIVSKGPAEIFESDCFVTITGNIVPGTNTLINWMSVHTLLDLVDDGNPDPAQTSGWFHRQPPYPLLVHKVRDSITSYTSTYMLHLFNADPSTATDWSVPLDGSGISHLTLAGDLVIYSDDSNTLHTRELGTGKLIWSTTGLGEIAKLYNEPGSPLIVQSIYQMTDPNTGRVFSQPAWKMVDLRDGEIVSAERGQIVWHSEVTDPVVRGSDATTASTGFIIASGRRVEGFKRNSGGVLWSVTLPHAVDEFSQVEWIDGYLIISGIESATLQIIEVQSKSHRYFEECVNSVFPFVVLNNSIATIDDHNVIKRIKVSDGSVVWECSASADQVVGVSGDSIVCTGYDDIHVFDATSGEVKFSIAGEPLDFSSAYLCVLNGDGQIELYRLTDGLLHLNLKLPDFVRLEYPRKSEESEMLTSAWITQSSCVVTNGMVLLAYHL